MKEAVSTGQSVSAWRQGTQGHDGMLPQSASRGVSQQDHAVRLLLCQLHGLPITGAADLSVKTAARVNSCCQVKLQASQLPVFMMQRLSQTSYLCHTHAAGVLEE